MPTGTYTPLANVTLGSSAASVTFSSIPATYRDLIVVVNGGGGDNVFLAINGDTTDANYSAVQMSGSGSVADGGAVPSFYNRILNNWGFMTNNLNTNYIVQFMDYSATDKHKTYLSRSNNAANGMTALAGRRANTAAITSVGILSSASFLTGSTFALYGVIA
jgi:hypothetical protein